MLNMELKDTLLQKKIFLSVILLKGRITEKRLETEKEMLNLLVHFPPPPDGCNHGGWAMLKAGSRNFSQVSHVHAGALLLSQA